MSLCTVLRAVPGGCKWLVAVAALSSIRVPLPFSAGTLSGGMMMHLNYMLVIIFLFCLKKNRQIALGQFGSPVTTFS